MGLLHTKEKCDEVDHKKPSLSSLYSNVGVDGNGCRRFSRPPQPGKHPRLFFNTEEIPHFLERFSHPEIGPHLRQVLNATRLGFLQYHQKLSVLSHEEFKSPQSQHTIRKFFVPDENRSVNILGAYVYGLLHEPDLASKAKGVALFYAKLIVKSKQLATEKNLTDKPFNVWHSNQWDLSTGWLFGGASFALCYDIMFNDLEQCEQSIFRKALTISVHGRRAWGMGWPSRRIQSNWAAYHGELLIMNAVVEEEEGFDKEVYAIFSDLMVNYLDYAFYDSGHPVEDSYAMNLGLREGSLCFLVMARRGHNVFNHPRYKQIWTKWLPYALEPHNSGAIYGGSSGNNWEYPTSAIIAKYAFPKDEVVDHVYRHYLFQNGIPYSRLMKYQARLASLIFSIPASNSEDEPEPIGIEQFPLDFICRARGKVVMRQNWSEKAMWFVLDARPDAFLIGHDTCSRGSFVINADGRNWGFCPEWNTFKESTDYSIPSIDGIGQITKAPFVKLGSINHEKCNSTYASADITYAYNWFWTVWAREGQKLENAGFEYEPNDPREFGHNAWWIPNKLHGERNVGFIGLHQWRKRFATVQKVFRSAILVRSAQPYVIIVDDIKKDSEMRKYSWAMTTANDVRLVSFDGTDAILQEEDSMVRRFLIRTLDGEASGLDCNFRTIMKGKHSVRQIVFSCVATSKQFRFLLFSLPSPRCAAPETTWNDDTKILKVHNTATKETQEVLFENGANGGTKMLVL